LGFDKEEKGQLEAELFELYKELVICDKLEEAGLHDIDNLCYYRECVLQDVINLHAQISEIMGISPPQDNFKILSKEGYKDGSPTGILFNSIYDSAKNEVCQRLKSVAC